MSYQGTTRPNHEMFALLAARCAATLAPACPERVFSAPACSYDDHDALRAELPAHVVALRTANVVDATPRAAAWLRTRKHWCPESTDMVMGNCTCGSTIVIELP